MGISILPIKIGCIFIFAAPLCLSQQITFEKILQNIKIEYVIDYPLEGYLFGTYDEIFKLNLNGTLLWRNNYQGRITGLIKNTDNLIVGLENRFGNNMKRIQLIKLNKSGNKLLEQTLPEVLSEYYITGGEDYVYILDIMGSHKIRIFKIDSDLNIIWVKECVLTKALGNIFKKRIILGENYSFYLGINDNIVKIDSSGSLLFEINNTPNNKLVLTSSGKLSFSNFHNISILDENNNTLFVKGFASGISSYSCTSDNGFMVCLVDSFYVRIDSVGNIIWQKKFREIGYNCMQTEDTGFLFTGDMDDNGWILKTNSNGLYISMNIYYPDGDIVLHNYRGIEGRYIANSDLINVYVSYNNKSNWELIKSDFSGDSGSFFWKPRFENAVDCYLKIEDAQNPSIYDETDSGFTIRLYNYHNYISANNVKMRISNNGAGSHNPYTDGPGFYWPGIDSNKTAIYQDGLFWGGIYHGEIRANGNYYRQGLCPGRILQNGAPSDPLETKNRIFKIKKGWETLPDGEEKDMLKADYKDWPGEFGAPYFDEDKNGVFTSGIDKPYFIGDEVLFYLSNDLDTGAATFTFGSLPIGLEFQTTIWGYDSSNYLKDVVFKRYIIINKSGKSIDSMYLGYWSDDDLGYANDDYIGCDTNLNIGFTYNGDNNDQGFYGSSPPAVAHMILQGPTILSGGSDSAKFKTRWIKGKYNSDITAFSGSFYFYDPGDHDLGVYSITLELYNRFKGLFPDGTKMTNLQNEPTKFILTGDPETGVGWYEGSGWPGGPAPNDRRQLLSTGPFTFAPGDTQEVVIAIFMAQGTNNLNSVTELKNTTAKLQEFWKNLDMNYSEGQIIPEGYVLYQNYPNPFNPATTIRYELPEWSNVELKVYDILGREVITLINKEQPAGKYRVEMNSGTVGNGLASGVYIYRLKTNNFVSSKKMLLIK